MEMDAYKQKVKKSLQDLINIGDLRQALNIISQYEQIIRDDVDIISMKSIIYIETGEIELAEELLFDAIRRNIISSDIFYNLAYIFHTKGENEQAVIFYKKSFETTSDLSLKKDINKILQSLNLNPLKIYKYRFSVVIPTRNSADTLKYTIKTCLNQKHDNFEIVISDNSSDDYNFTKELIKNFNDPRIKYYRPDEELAMTENYNYAISKALGEYVIMLGSDDGLLFHALSTLDSILPRTGIKLLHWRMAAYGWPNIKLKGYENFFGFPLNPKGTINYNEIDSNTIIKKVINFETNYSILPMLYCNSVVHQDLLEILIKNTGSVFKGYPPDVYSGFALAYIQNKYITVDLPMTIGGSSGNSIGIAYHHGKGNSNELKKDYIRLNNKAGLSLHNIIPDVKSLEAAVAESFLNAKDVLFPNDHELCLDRKLLIQKCVEGLDKNDTTYSQELKKIESSLEDEPQLRKWFKENYLMKPTTNNYSNKAKFSYKVGFENGNLSLNSEDFNVKNVYDAASLFSKITGW
ncbi:glycosyltransferase family 2 protein [Robertmurraya kyonggiensis]|uniref:Glycosyltransferase n=1 Tax=Robertmurraya kyonggiensis TaxID=1037680 RepID=A0A4U1D3Y9_9BACI|nr:glycosyltransferase family 2 protein [Robertmurraya kyonggiensis]TKC17041.1 glycosyltransferase [Robertmurraya kyonggiensis]